MRKPAIALAVIALAVAAWFQQRPAAPAVGQPQEPTRQSQSTQQAQPQWKRAPTSQPQEFPRTATGEPSARGGEAVAIDAAVAQHLHGVRVQGAGRVDRVLADDTQGSPHQRFLLRLDSGATVLVAHNTELAPRLDALQPGDTVAFSGEYVWNPKGGVVHWTHHDPSGRHAAGWLRHAGQLSQ